MRVGSRREVVSQSRKYRWEETLLRLLLVNAIPHPTARAQCPGDHLSTIPKSQYTSQDRYLPPQISQRCESKTPISRQSGHLATPYVTPLTHATTKIPQIYSPRNIPFLPSTSIPRPKLLAQSNTKEAYVVHGTYTRRFSTDTTRRVQSNHHIQTNPTSLQNQAKKATGPSCRRRRYRDSLTAPSRRTTTPLGTYHLVLTALPITSPGGSGKTNSANHIPRY